MRRSAALVCVCAWLAIAGCTRQVPLVTAPVPPVRSEPIPIGRGDLPSDRFGRLFCAVLNHVPAAPPWGYCGRYFEPAGTPAPLDSVSLDGASLDGALPSTMARYRVLVVPGIFGQCVQALARPFEDAKRHLQDAHRVNVEYVSVSAIGGSAYNARQIADYLQREFTAADNRRYIAFGYSKGTSDLLEALAAHQIARDAVAAVVSVAGTVLGSRLTDGVPTELVRFLERNRLGTCDVGDGGAIDSLRRSERVAAVARFAPPAGLRVYSMASASDAATTSSVLENGWQSLRAYSLEQDSQVIHEDAIVPGSTYLGMAKADHWAVALPFSDVPDSHEAKALITRMINRNVYPRAALFEAALRFVLADLPPPTN